MINIPDKDCFLHLFKKSDVRRAKIVAVAFKSNGSVLCAETNRCYWGHNKQRTIHAEDFLIRKLNKMKIKNRYRNVFLLILRHTISKGWSNAKPCNKCSVLISKFGFRNVFYSNEIGDIEKASI